MLECHIEIVQEELKVIDDPTFDEVLLIAKKIDHPMKCVEVLKKNSTEVIHAIGRESRKKEYVKDDVKKKEHKGWGVMKNQSKEQKRCFGCDKTGHHADD
ncbi:hypothetical protein NDU88_001769 [Pleurodeles waltl]|uniref:CCHC-type domain-containing protein n=1 Tax=Pleurodeles waltl TaxID=8319 RepID=A0AAV7UV56_PLEWA|nr:hypothetical protein NDU88_001769 [Pleurodeles waltl]